MFYTHKRDKRMDIRYNKLQKIVCEEYSEGFISEFNGSQDASTSLIAIYGRSFTTLNASNRTSTAQFSPN